MSPNFLFSAAFGNMNICDAVPKDGLGVLGSRILKPATPAESTMWLRIDSVGPERMPPIGKNFVDPAGSSLINAWIQSINSCP